MKFKSLLNFFINYPVIWTQSIYNIKKRQSDRMRLLLFTSLRSIPYQSFKGTWLKKKLGKILRLHRRILHFITKNNLAFVQEKYVFAQKKFVFTQKNLHSRLYLSNDYLIVYYYYVMLPQPIHSLYNWNFLRLCTLDACTEILYPFFTYI